MFYWNEVDQEVENQKSVRGTKNSLHQRLGDMKYHLLRKKVPNFSGCYI